MTLPPPRGPLLVSLADRRPRLAPGAWAAPSATLVGDVHLHPGASIWYGAVARADTERVEIGPDSNVQDGSILHADAGYPTLLGAGVSVGHRAVVHGTVVEDNVLIGMAAVLLNGTRVGRGSLIAAGTVVREGMQVPPGTLVTGVPGEVRRPLTPEDTAHIRRTAEHYRGLTCRHARAVLEG